jgi:hypothetical protein
MSKLDDIINKSLDDINAIVEDGKASITKSAKPAVLEVGEEVKKSAKETADLVKSGDVSADAPQEDTDEEENTDDEGEEESNGDDNGDGTDEEDDEGAAPETEKSLTEDLNGNDSVRKALEVSEFLTALVKSMQTVFDEQGTKIQKSIDTTGTQTDFLVKSFEGIAKSTGIIVESQGALLKSIRVLNKRVRLLEETPQIRKSLSSKSQVQPIEKSFGKTEVEPVNPKLEKSMNMNKLMTAFQGGNTVLQNDILSYESTGDKNMLSQSAKTVLNAK